MSNDISSRDKWRNLANYDKALTDATRAQQQNITMEELQKHDEAQRLAKLPEKVEPENQKAISQSVAQVEPEKKEQNSEKTYDWKEEWQNSEIDNSSTLEVNHDNFKEVYDTQNTLYNSSKEEPGGLYERSQDMEGKSSDHKSDAKEGPSKSSPPAMSKSGGFEPEP